MPGCARDAGGDEERDSKARLARERLGTDTGAEKKFAASMLPSPVTRS